MTDVLVQAQGLSKSYPAVSRHNTRLRALVSLLFGRNAPDGYSVLMPMDLVVRRGESTAIIGENGAGKSTLLKLITKVLTPTTGSVQTHGSIGALLELGAGFHPEYTGRENLRMAGALAGLSIRELRRCQAEIIEFADIGRYIDEPIKHYSSGMVVRLGFAIVASLRPDLLITDEVLAVGDESFQKKCIGWIENYLAGGGTLLLVSHGMYHVQKLCKHAIWLQRGELVRQGDVFSVTQAYLAYQSKKLASAESNSSQTPHDYAIDTWSVNGYHHPMKVLLGENERNLELSINIHSRDGDQPHVHIGITRPDGSPVYGVGSDMSESSVAKAMPKNKYGFNLSMDLSALLPGSYQLKLLALDGTGLRLFDTVEIELILEGQTREFGVYRVPHVWNRLQ